MPPPPRSPASRARTPSASAAGNSAGSATRTIPTEEPSRAGLTNTGSPSAPSSPSTRAPLGGKRIRARTARYATCGSPACAISSLNITLSMHSADASTPAPTYGTSRHSSSPCTVPSSPNGPCRTGNTTSTPSSPRPGVTATTDAVAPPHPVAAHLDRDRLVSGLGQPLADRRRRGERHLVLGGAASPEHRDTSGLHFFFFSASTWCPSASSTSSAWSWWSWWSASSGRRTCRPRSSRSSPSWPGSRRPGSG